MAEAPFSHLYFWQNPLSTLCFFSLAMSFLSLWVKKTAWLWGSFLAISYALALIANIATPITLIPIGLLLICHAAIKKDISYAANYLLFAVITAISIGLYFHFLPGFQNWQIVSNVKLSPNAYPYSLWFNFDKPFIGIFALVFGLPLIASKEQIRHMLKMAIPLSLIGIGILMGISLLSGMVQWDPKIPVTVFPG